MSRQLVRYCLMLALPLLLPRPPILRKPNLPYWEVRRLNLWNALQSRRSSSRPASAGRVSGSTARATVITTPAATAATYATGAITAASAYAVTAPGTYKAPLPPGNSVNAGIRLVSATASTTTCRY